MDRNNFKMNTSRSMDRKIPPRVAWGITLAELKRRATAMLLAIFNRGGALPPILALVVLLGLAAPAAAQSVASSNITTNSVTITLTRAGYIGNWHYAVSGGTVIACTGNVSGDSVTITGLNQAVSHTVTVYATCEGPPSARLINDKILEATFTTLSGPTLSVDDTFSDTDNTHDTRTSTSLTMILTNHSTAWYYKYTTPTGGTCSSAVSAGTTWATVDGLTPNTSYTFKAYSDAACGTVLATATALATLRAKITDVTVSPLNADKQWRGLYVEWTGQDGAEEYEIQWKSDSDSGYNDGNRQIKAGKSGHVVNTWVTLPGAVNADMDNGTAYTVRVRSISSSGLSSQGEWSDEVSGTPAVETLTASNISSSGATLTLGNYRGQGDWYYRQQVFTDNTNTSGNTQDGPCTGPVSGATVRLTGLRPGTNYKFAAFSNSDCTATPTLGDPVTFTTKTAPVVPSVTPEPIPVPALKANAGRDTTVAERAVVKLKGTVNRSSTNVKWAWKQRGGPSVSLDNAQTATPTFTAPALLLNDAQLTFRLTVTQGDEQSTDDVQITVKASPNGAPVTHVGRDRRVPEGVTVTLTGSATDPEGEAVTYAWTQIGGAEVSLSGADTARPTFKAPKRLTENAVLTFSLTATDARGAASAAQTVSVTVRAGVTVHAMDAEQTVKGGSAVRLAGTTETASESVSYVWVQMSGPAVQLSNRGATARPTFVAPKHLREDTVLTFVLIVTDACSAASAIDTVDIPVQAAARGKRVTLSSDKAADSAGTYVWTQAAGPSAVLLNSYTAQATFTEPTDLREDAVLTFMLIATDACDPIPVVHKESVTVKAGEITALAFPADAAVDDQEYTAGTEIGALVLPAAVGGAGALTYSVSGLPTGLTFDPATRTVTGTPAAATNGAVEITYTATDANGATASLTFNITINPVLSFESLFDLFNNGAGKIVPTASPDVVALRAFVVGQRVVSLTLPAATGGRAPLTYSLSPVLPPGLMFDAATRTITGTPQAAGASEYTYTVTDATGAHVSLLLQTLPTAFALDKSYPNPFNPTTTIQYALPQDADVGLTIYNIAGQAVRTLVAEPQCAGRYAVEWDATDDRGQPLSSGLYFYRLRAGDEFAAVEKMLLLK